MSKITFLTDMMEKGHTQEEVFAVLFESEREKKRREMLAIATKTVDAHRLQTMRDLLAFNKLAIFRRINGFDRVVDVCVFCVFFPFILDIKFIGRTSRGHTGGRSQNFSSTFFLRCVP